MILKRTLLLFCFGLIVCTAKGQQFVGEIRGGVKDPELNRVIPAATVSVYLMQDSSIVEYTLTDDAGGFKLNKLPLETDLFISVSFVGYKRKSVAFYLKDLEILDLSTIHLLKDNKTLEEVEILAPVRMNGDTLEFNADAFKMDPSAVAEDLLKKLPGVIVWGDGTITVNGREISSLMVNGKPFFGGRATVATQNIAKDAINKVQVYQKERNSSDSISEVNIQLKDEKSFGYFGKAIVGAGSINKYESDLNINAFNKRTQVSTVIGKNNVNKESDDINTLLEASTYKGAQLNTNYQTNFNKPGETGALRGGILLSHDLKDYNSQKEKNTFTLNYLYNNTHQDVERSDHVLTNINSDNIQERLGQSLQNKKRGLNSFKSQYEYRKNNVDFSITGRLKQENIELTSLNADSVQALYGNILSRRKNSEYNDGKSTNAGLDFSISHTKRRDNETKIPADWKIGYIISKTNNRENRLLESNFKSYLDPTDYFDINRDNESLIEGVTHKLTAKWGDFWNVFTKRKDYNKTLFLTNNIELGKRNVYDDVYDIIEENRKQNTLLSFNRTEHTIDWKPGLTFQHTFIKLLSGRFQKEGKLEISADYQMFSLKNASDRHFQNFDRLYRNINPTIAFNYKNNQIDEYVNAINTSFHISNEFPTVDDLFPIVDTTNVYGTRYGNPDLKSAKRKEFQVDFSHRKSKKTAFMYKASLKIGDINNFQSISMEYDASGRSIIKPVNVDAHKYISIGGNIDKAIEFDQNLLLLKWRSSWTGSKTPMYMIFDDELNVLQQTTNSIVDADVNVTFNYKNVLDLNVNYALYHLHSRKDDANLLKNNSHRIETKTLFRPTGQMTIGSNASYYKNVFYGAAQKYTIWNAWVSYRFMKQNNLELTVSGNDILDQNRILNVRNLNNVISQNQTNSIGRFYMVSLSYYPRKFGER